MSLVAGGSIDNRFNLAVAAPVLVSSKWFWGNRQRLFLCLANGFEEIDSTCSCV